MGRSIRRRGWTLLELVLAMTVLVMVGYNGLSIMRMTSTSVGSTSLRMELDDQAIQTLDRLALAIMSADRDSLDPAGEGVNVTNLRYQASLGIVDGEVVWADPEEVGLGERPNQVVWKENPESEIERRVVWSNAVAELLEGEIPNGIDDNANGFIDENGLSLVVDGESVWIRLSLQRTAEGGDVLTKTVETVVAVRN